MLSGSNSARSMGDAWNEETLSDPMVLIPCLGVQIGKVPPIENSRFDPAP